MACYQAAKQQKQQGREEIRGLRSDSGFMRTMIFCKEPSFNPKLANPPTPYSSQKRPEPQICPTCVLEVAFEGSSQGDWNLNLRSGHFRIKFDKFP